MSEERWLPVVGYEGYYEVSDLGRMRRLDNYVRHKSGGQSFVPGRILKIKPGVQGYPEARLSVNGRVKSFMVHSLVLRVFVGPPPPGMETCHGDGVRSNNRLSNLRWDTRAGNLHDMREHGTHHYGSRPACKYGHQFAGPNLVMRGANRRECLACSRARAYLFTHPELNHQEVSDRYYAEIMGKAA